MADLKPKKINLAEINGGVQYEKGDGIQQNAINDPIQASAYAQALATNQPNLENVDNFGVPKVSIEEVNGVPRFKFENLSTVEISSIEQTEKSVESSGKNVMTVSLNNGEQKQFTFYNGATGAKLVSRVLQGEDQDGGNIYLDTFDDGTTAYFTAPRGRTADKISDWMGTKSIGSPTQPLYYDGEKGEFVAYDFPYRAKTLEECSWWEINELSKAGKAKDYFYVGEIKTIGTKMFRIIGFDHDDLSDGSGKAGITFEMITSMGTATSSNFNARLSEAESQLDSEIRAFIKSVTKKTYDAKNNILTSTPKTTFCLSIAEIMTVTENYYEKEGERYEYYTDGRSLIKLVGGAPRAWILRSKKNINSVSLHYFINSDGNLEYGSSGYLLYPCFCI